jgi:hypothetical protein
MDTPFFDSLIDDFGIWQHTDGQNILTDEGYALDDAARGLLVCLALKKTEQAEVLFEYLRRSCHNTGFYGFATAKHRFFQYPASDDATGQVVWAMGYAYSLGFHAKEAKAVIDGCLPCIMKFEHMRGYAYALLGAIYIDKALAKELVDKLLDFFNKTNSDWLWPESVMTYGNGILPYAFLRYGLVSNNETVSQFGLKVCEFVQKKCELNNRILGPIGNDGWLSRAAHTVPAYSQQPIDAAYMIWAWLAVYELFGQKKHYDLAKKWFCWSEGNNIQHERMFDPITLKCFDGIDKTGVHYHSGAESNICLLLTLNMLDRKTTI